jgi:hypothetical protein
MVNTLEKEIEFGEMFGSYKLSPPDVDMIEHWDVSVQPWVFEDRITELRGAMYAKHPLDHLKVINVLSGDDYKIDVKAIPKGQQSHSWRWVEFRNVRGDRGWMYGDSDFIAFEYGEYWIIVPTRSLQLLCETKLDPSPIDGRAWSANPQPYRLHQREDRQDQVMMVPVVDLCWIGIIIQKPKS